MKSIRRLFVRFFQMSLLLLCGAVVYAESSNNDINAQVILLQENVDALERDISALEKDLLFPPLTRVNVYLSHSADINFTLRSLTLSLNGKEKSFHIYSESDINALRLGGLQQFWEGNVALGTHTLEARIEGLSRKGKPLKQFAKLTFEKKLSGKTFELHVSAAEKKNKAPTLRIKEWSE